MTGAGYGAIAGAAGGLIQAVAAGLAANAMKNTFGNQLDLQAGLRNQALVGAFQPRLQTSGVETAREEIGAGSQKRQDAYGRLEGTRLGLGQKTGERERGKSRLFGKARADLSGYSDHQLDQMIHTIRTQDELNRISNFAGGEARIFPYKLDAAKHEYDQLSFFGQLVSSLGGAAGNYAQLFGAGGQPQAQPQQQAIQPMFGQSYGNNFGANYY